MIHGLIYFHRHLRMIDLWVKQNIVFFLLSKYVRQNKFLKIVLESAERRSNNALPRIKFRITILIEDHQ